MWAKSEGGSETIPVHYCGVFLKCTPLQTSVQTVIVFWPLRLAWDTQNPGIFASSLLDGHNYGEICFKTLLVLASFDLCVGKNHVVTVSVCIYNYHHSKKLYRKIQFVAVCIVTSAQHE